MKMSINYHQAFEHYQRKYHGSLVFYRMEGEYIAIMDDADALRNIYMPQIGKTDDAYYEMVFSGAAPPTDRILKVGIYHIHESLFGEIYDTLLSRFGKSVVVVRERDENGKYCIPNIAQSETEKEEDY